MKLRYTQPFKEIYNHIAPGYLIFRAVDLVLDKAQNEKEMLYDTENEISVTKDIQYTENRAWQKYCGLDLYRKASETPQPVLFYTHGGGFDAGRRYHRRGMSTWMAKTGICVVNVDFGLSPRFTFKETLHMIVEAANWVVDHADEYNFDLSKVMVGGDTWFLSISHNQVWGLTLKSSTVTETKILPPKVCSIAGKVRRVHTML